jgi:hypothetical protein
LPGSGVHVSRIANGIGHPLEFIAKHFFEWFPVDEAIDFVQEAIIVFAVSGNIVGNIGFLKVRSLMVASICSDGGNKHHLLKFTIFYWNLSCNGLNLGSLKK